MRSNPARASRAGWWPVLACVLAAAAPPVHAAWYQVEAIVFAHVNVDADGESWYQNPGLPTRDDTIELITATAEAAPVDGAPVPVGDVPRQIAYLALGKEQYRLSGVHRVLSLTRDYRPLLHVAWQQPGEGPERGQAVHLEAYREPAESRAADPAVTGALAALPSAVVDGVIRLRSTRFLHVDVDFAYFPEDLGALVDSSAAGLPVYEQADYVRLRENRKIKLNELHYFDHPLFGVIVQVSRLAFPEEE